MRLFLKSQDLLTEAWSVRERVDLDTLINVVVHNVIVMRGELSCTGELCSTSA